MWAAWLVFYYSIGNKTIVPSLWDSLKGLWNYLSDGGFWIALGNTSLRTLYAFAISFALAAILAALGALSRMFRLILNPIMVVVRILPTLAVMLIILKATRGNRALSPVIVTVLVLFPMIYARIVAAVDAIDGGIMEMAKIYQVSRRERIFKIYIPLVSPSVLPQIGADLSLGLKIMISAEVLANTARGLGGMMQESSLASETANLFALTLAAIVLGLIVDAAFSQFSRITDRWKRSDG